MSGLFVSVSFWIILVLVLIVLWIIITANKLTRKRMKAEQAFADMDVYLTQRYDLIPNLVSTVKGYSKHEKETFEAVVKARNAAVSATDMNAKIDADNNVTEAIGKLFALAEAYPELKANENFLKLQEDLKDTEDKITYARQFYNDSAMSYNNLIQMFPSNIVASIFGFKKYNYFEASEKDKETPKVSF